MIVASSKKVRRYLTTALIALAGVVLSVVDLSFILEAGLQKVKLRNRQAAESLSFGQSPLKLPPLVGDTGSCLANLKCCKQFVQLAPYHGDLFNIRGFMAADPALPAFFGLV